MKYDRLTEKSECGYNTLNGCFNCDLEMDCGLCPYWTKALDRLAELEDKIEQGNLIEIPTIDEEILEDYAHRMFDSWNDITGAIHNGCSWYGEVLSVIDDIVGMVYGITKRQAEKHLKELQNG